LRTRSPGDTDTSDTRPANGAATRVRSTSSCARRASACARARRASSWARRDEFANREASVLQRERLTLLGLAELVYLRLGTDLGLGELPRALHLAAREREQHLLMLERLAIVVEALPLVLDLRANVGDLGLALLEKQLGLPGVENHQRLSRRHILSLENLHLVNVRRHPGRQPRDTGRIGASVERELRHERPRTHGRDVHDPCLLLSLERVSLRLAHHQRDESAGAEKQYDNGKEASHDTPSTLLDFRRARFGSRPSPREERVSSLKNHTIRCL